MYKLKTMGFILFIPTLLTMELCYLAIAIFNNKFRGKYLIDRLAFNKFVEPEIEYFTGVKQNESED